MRARGFSLIEVMVALAIMSIVAAYLAPQYIQEIRARRIERTVAEISQLYHAAQEYHADHGAWPDESNGCANSLKTLVTSGYLPLGTSPNSPFYDATTNPAGRYATSCTTTAPVRFKIKVATTPDAAGRLANDLPMTSVSGAVTETSVPTLAGILALKDYLRLDGSRAMTGNLDMGEHDIQNAASVNARKWVDRDDPSYVMDPSDLSTFKKVRVTGDICQTGNGGKVNCLSEIPDMAIYDNGDLVPKPSCTNDYKTGTPAILTTPVVLMESGTPRVMYGYQAVAQDMGANWKIRIYQLTEGGWSEPSSPYARAMVSVFCEVTS